MPCGAQRELLPVAVGAMNIHDVRDRLRQTDVRRQTADHCLMHPPRGRGHNKSLTVLECRSWCIILHLCVRLCFLICLYIPILLFRMLFLSIISTAYHLLSGSRAARLLLN